MIILIMILSVLFRPFGLFALKDFKISWLSNFSILSVLDEGYSNKKTRRAH